MIGFIRGKVIYTEGNKIIVDNNGVGYKLECNNLGIIEGQDVQLFVSTYMRESELKLFGFKSQMDLKVFELLLDVNGVGPKAAILLVGNLGFHKIINAISFNKPDTLKLKGIGQKTAQKIVLELTNKIKAYQMISERSVEGDSEPMFDERTEDAKQALLNLGFKEREIDVSLERLATEINSEITTQQIIKILLRDLRK
jgi:Holliday junction DNA helicase RuvA